MRKIILWYNKNRRTIFMFLGVFFIIFIFLQLFNYLSKTNKKNNYTNNITNDKIDYQLNSIKLDDDKSVISGSQLTEGQIKATKVIDDFVLYCNEGQIDKAYSLVSDDCKKELYPTLEDFKKSYYNSVFNGEKKKVSIENWTSSIYKVKYNTDSLSTGIFSEEGIIQDYITIIMDSNNNYRLNINSYLGKQKTNVFQDFEDIHIEVAEINTYMDYQEYVYNVKNESKNVILLDDKENINSLYIEDENDIKYKAMTHEISKSELQLFPDETKTIKIKYYNKFNSGRKIRYSVFSNVILNYNDLENRKNVSIKIQL